MKKTSRRKQLTIVSICVLFVVVLVGGILAVVALKNQTTINSFKECADAGYPIQSNCLTPKGVLYQAEKPLPTIRS